MTNLTFFCFAKQIYYMPVHDAFEEVFGIYLFSSKKSLQTIELIANRNLNAAFVTLTLYMLKLNMKEHIRLINLFFEICFGNFTAISVSLLNFFQFVINHQ